MGKKKKKEKQKEKKAKLSVKTVKEKKPTEELQIPEPAYDPYEPEEPSEIRPEAKVFQTDLAEAAAVFRALGDEGRMQILRLLGNGELCAAEILRSVNIVQSTLSHHMKILTEAGVVGCRKEGKRTYYSIQWEILEGVSDYLKKWS